MRDIMDFIKMAQEYSDNPFGLRPYRFSVEKEWEAEEKRAADLAVDEERQRINQNRPHISFFLTWSELREIGQEKIGREFIKDDREFAAHGLRMGLFPSQWHRYRNPLYRVDHLLTEEERQEFLVWLNEQECEYQAQRKKEAESRHRESIKARRAQIKALGGKWWKIY